MDIEAPSFYADDALRSGECRRVFDQAARALVLRAVQAGWRESEAAMALADAADRYVMYLATVPRNAPLAANSNLLPSAGCGV
jgi:hypothetical protein